MSCAAPHFDPARTLLHSDAELMSRERERADRAFLRFRSGTVETCPVRRFQEPLSPSESPFPSLLYPPPHLSSRKLNLNFLKPRHLEKAKKLRVPSCNAACSPTLRASCGRASRGPWFRVTVCPVAGIYVRSQPLLRLGALWWRCRAALPGGDGCRHSPALRRGGLRLPRRRGQLAYVSDGAVSVDGARHIHRNERK